MKRESPERLALARLLMAMAFAMAALATGCGNRDEPATTSVSAPPTDVGQESGEQPSLETTDAQAVLDGLLEWIRAEPTKGEYGEAYVWTYGESGQPRRVERGENLHESLIPTPAVVSGDNYFVEMGREVWTRMSPDIARRAYEMEDVAQPERMQPAFLVAALRYFDPLRVLEQLRPGIAVDAGENWYLAGTVSLTDLLGMDLPNFIYRQREFNLFAPELTVTGFVRKSDHRPVRLWLQELDPGRGPEALDWSRTTDAPELPADATPYLGIDDGSYEDAELSFEQLTERMLERAWGNLVLRGSGREVTIGPAGTEVRLVETGEAPIVGVGGTVLFREGGHQRGGSVSEIYWPQDLESERLVISLEELAQAFASSPPAGRLELLLEARDRFLLALLNDPYLVLSVTEWSEEVASAPRDTSLNEGAKWRLSGTADVREVLGAGRDGEAVLRMVDASLAAAAAGLAEENPPVLDARYQVTVDVAADGRPVYWRRTLDPPLPEGEFTPWHHVQGEAQFIGQEVELGPLPEAKPIE